MRFTKETLKRAIRTFTQAAIAYIAANCVVIDLNNPKEVQESAWIGLGVAAIAAGLAAIMNMESDDNV